MIMLIKEPTLNVCAGVKEKNYHKLEESIRNYFITNIYKQQTCTHLCLHTSLANETMMPNTM